MADSASLGSAHNALAATFSDTDDVPDAGQWRAFRYGGAVAADVAVILDGDADAVPFTNVQPGEVIAAYVKRVMATDTTASAGTVILLK